MDLSIFPETICIALPIFVFIIYFTVDFRRLYHGEGLLCTRCWTSKKQKDRLNTKELTIALLLLYLAGTLAAVGFWANTFKEEFAI